MALVHKVRLGVRADMYLVGGATLPLCGTDMRSNGCMYQRGMQYYVRRREADGLLTHIHLGFADDKLTNANDSGA